MNNLLVLYKSKYGAAKKYAAMLKEELPCDVFDLADYKKASPENYRQILFAGGIYASGIAGLSTLRKHYPNLKHKKIAILCVGASPFDEKAFAELKTHNLKDDLKDIPLFYGRGAWDEQNMTLKDRALCKMLQKMLSRQDPSSYEPWMKALLDSSGQAHDWTDRKYLVPLLEYFRAEN
ncbi:MAG: flavodoxin domain-containing protein [Eubacteriales bacterium]|nr:flavodoxin domain-containing protein [Eubacteriales bacterium]